MLSQAWGHESVLRYFDDHRNKTTDIYPSEWFFLKNLLRPGMSILDIGCAKGGLATVLAEHLAEFNYVGLDVNNEMIVAAKELNPTQTFHQITNNNFSMLNHQQFDLVVVLGILHLNVEWRETLALAWAHTKTHFLFDLRETHLTSIEDQTISSFSTNYDGGESPLRLPYNIINASDALAAINHTCQPAKKMSHYGYTQAISHLAKSPIDTVMANVYCIEKG